MEFKECCQRALDRDLSKFPTMKELKLAYLEHVSKLCEHKKGQVAKVLGINRRTLYRRSFRAD